jgi:hypothetical protein
MDIYGMLTCSDGQQGVPGLIPNTEDVYWKSDDPDLSIHDWVWQRRRFRLTEFKKVLLVGCYVCSKLDEMIEHLGLIERS